MAALNDQAIRQGLAKMQGWAYVANNLRKQFQLKTFPAGIEFVNRIAQAAESAGHHPDITINYNVVGINLSTHSDGGVTDKDFDLAQKIDRLYAELA